MEEAAVAGAGLTIGTRVLMASLLAGLPAALILVHLLWRRHKKGYRIAEVPTALLVPTSVCGLAMFSVLNLLMNWSVGFAVMCPLLGMGLSLLGLLLAFVSRLTGRWGLIAANTLLFIVSLCSIVAPN